jgi:hypothetical protein
VVRNSKTWELYDSGRFDMLEHRPNVEELKVIVCGGSYRNLKLWNSRAPGDARI